MPHLVDKETGLCVVCKRLEIAAINEGKKYKRQHYDVRKMAIDKLTNKEDPNYRAIIDRHYVKYRDNLDEKDKQNATRYAHQELTETPRGTAFKKTVAPSTNRTYKPNNAAFNYEPTKNQIRDKNQKNPGFRDTLRRVNLANASRLNNQDSYFNGSQQVIYTTSNMNTHSNPKTIKPATYLRSKQPVSPDIPAQKVYFAPTENDFVESQNQIVYYDENDNEDLDYLDNSNTGYRYVQVYPSEVSTDDYVEEPQQHVQYIPNYIENEVYQPKKNKTIVVHHHYGTKEEDYDADADGIYYMESPRNVIYNK